MHLVFSLRYPFLKYIFLKFSLDNQGPFQMDDPVLLSKQTVGKSETEPVILCYLAKPLCQTAAPRTNVCL